MSEKKYVTNFTFPNGETFYVKDEDTYTKEEIDNKIDSSGSGGDINVQSDWNQTDSTADDYIKNKPDIYTKAEINQKLVGAMTYKGTKAAVSGLPNSGNQQGDVWHVNADGSEWAWNGSFWEELGKDGDAVLYTAQSLTNEQKEQARENIKAGTSSVRVNASDGTITIDDIYIGSANPHTYQFKTIFLITAVYSNGEYTFDRNQADILSAIQRGQLPVVRYHTNAGQNDYHVYYEWVFSYYTYDGEDVYIYFSRLDQYGDASLLRWFGSTGKAVVVTKPTLPPTTSADNGKIPVVNSFGNYQLQIPSSGEISNTVLYTQQTLTDAQKAQARENIGAVTITEVQTAIDNAFAAIPFAESEAY